MKNIKRIFNKKAFSVVELLTVVGLIGILAAIAIPSYKSYIQGALKGRLINYLNDLSSEIRLLFDVEPEGQMHPYRKTGTELWPIAFYKGWDKIRKLKDQPIQCKHSNYIECLKGLPEFKIKPRGVFASADTTKSPSPTFCAVIYNNHWMGYIAFNFDGDIWVTNTEDQVKRDSSNKGCDNVNTAHSDTALNF